MILRADEFIFHGGLDDSPMEWGIELYDDGRWAVVETYDYGQSWLCNCSLATADECVQFIRTWFKQFE
jgi:hypothetical protein